MIPTSSNYNYRLITEIKQPFDVMIDLETLGTAKDSGIVQICAVPFDSLTGQIWEDKIFNVKVNINSLIDYSLDPSTLIWWLNQPNVKDILLEGDRFNINDAVCRFNVWGNSVNLESNLRLIWGNAPSFDLCILGHTLKKCKHDVPWKFYNEACYRTYKRLVPKDYYKELVNENPHDAYYDAIFQAKQVYRINQYLGIKEYK